MKILIVSTSDLAGGAARAAHRLHESLIEQGIDSQMLVQTKISDEYRVLTFGRKYLNKLRTVLDGLPIRRYKNRSATDFSTAYFPFSKVIKQINRIRPDIVHLHWICGGMMPVEDLTKIKAPIVWNLQDMWAFTGGCHYDEKCGAYQQKCGNCKVLRSPKESDLSRSVWNRKANTFSKIRDLTLVGVSQWITDCSKSSSLFKNRPHFRIPNAINTDIFRPLEKKIARPFFNIPLNKKIILFGAASPLGDPRKGGIQLLEALSHLNLQDVEVVIAGQSQPPVPIKLNFPVHYIAPVADEMSLALIYNIADVVIVPSLQENLANTVIESLACGVPVVAFNIGGNQDMISHMENGFLAKENDSKDLAHGIEWIIQHNSPDAISQASRKKALDTYQYRIVAPQYIDLYTQILEKCREI